jgi:hypothetical protein
MSAFGHYAAAREPHTYVLKTLVKSEHATCINTRDLCNQIRRLSVTLRN